MRDSVYEVCRYCFSAVSADGRIAVSAPNTLYRVYRWNADGTFDGFFTRDNAPLVEFTNAEKDSVVQMRRKAGSEAVAGGLTVSKDDYVRLNRIAGLRITLRGVTSPSRVQSW